MCKRTRTTRHERRLALGYRGRVQPSASQPRGRDRFGGPSSGRRTSGGTRPLTLGLAALAALVVYRKRTGREPGARGALVVRRAALTGAAVLGATLDDPVSPELALVDSALRDRLSLDTEAAQATVEEPQPTPDADGRHDRKGETHRRYRRFVVASVILVAAAIVAALAVAHVDEHGGSGAARATTTATLSPSTAAGEHRSVGRDFAWAPVRGASGYDVEIQRNGEIVYATRTSVAHLTVPLRWKLGGPTRSLSPGTYRWYVWPVVRGRRGPAVVATTFQLGA